MFNPFRTAQPFWGQITRNWSQIYFSLQCSSKRAKPKIFLAGGPAELKSCPSHVSDAVLYNIICWVPISPIGLCVGLSSQVISKSVVGWGV